MRSVILNFFLWFFFLNVFAQQANDPYLYGMSESRTIREALENADTIEFLNLKKKKLEEFPMEILKLPHLKALSLRLNKIDSIPDTIAHLKELEYLDLGTNPLTEFPKAVLSLSSLKILILANTLIPSIPEEINQLKKLEKLIIWGTECKHLPESIASMNKHLKVLDIRLTKVQNEAERDKLEELLPNTEILFPAPCNCMSNQ